ncbi:UNVERIFIED_CONTAM: hypothetical protein Scaly_0471500 [Sesamum calycinum]|uniref:Uncharacterized protein n=1 Tax=Sesamum calycinum TaxID=2727403 RepID=A0AAW2SG83_9LAMI
MYVMGCFRLPISLIKEIQSMISNFWWHNGDSRKIHWLNCRRLCTPKAQRGLGVRDLQAFNLAMLAKQMWRIITNRIAYSEWSAAEMRPSPGRVFLQPNRWFGGAFAGKLIWVVHFMFGTIL